MHGPTEFFDVAHHRLEAKARAARFVLCISDFARSQLMPLIPPEQWGKLQILHCGVDLEQFRMARNAKAATRRLEDAKAHEEELDADGHRQTRTGGGDRVELLCVARLSAVKGHAILLKVVEELALRGHDVHLNLIGDGPLRGALEELAETMSISNRVTFHGSVGQDVIHRHYAAADVFVLPSFAEGVPVVLMEAMAAKCPVVATRINGIPELIEDGVTGLLVAPGRPDLLANAVERIVAGPRQAERMALAAHEKIKRDYNLRSIGPQLDAIFHTMLNHKGRAAAAGAAAAPVREELVEEGAE
jgi:glycosyltransferase involved in cell wall biosynthesis